MITVQEFPTFAKIFIPVEEQNQPRGENPSRPTNQPSRREGDTGQPSKASFSEEKGPDGKRKFSLKGNDGDRRPPRQDRGDKPAWGDRPQRSDRPSYGDRPQKSLVQVQEAMTAVHHAKTAVISPPGVTVHSAATAHLTVTSRVSAISLPGVTAHSAAIAHLTAISHVSEISLPGVTVHSGVNAVTRTTGIKNTPNAASPVTKQRKNLPRAQTICVSTDSWPMPESAHVVKLMR